MTEVGARVWAVRETDDTTVYTYGFGTYIGDRLLDGWNHPSTLATCLAAIRRSDANEDAGEGFDPRPFYDRLVADGKMSRAEADEAVARGTASAAAERQRPLAERAEDLARAMGMNPVIRLEAGGFVWGAECWWGDADDDTPARYARGRKIVVVPAPLRNGGVR